MQLDKVRGIVLKAIKHKESDLILNVLSQEGEKISLLAKGALRSKKRFAGGVLEPSHYIEMVIQSGPSKGDLRILQEASLISDFRGIRNSYDKLEVAFYILDCISRVSLEGEGAKSLFDLAGNSLTALSELESGQILKVHFGLKLLYQQGVLEPENWMKDYLATPIRNVDSIKTNAKDLDSKIFWLEDKMQTYLKTGY